MTVAVRDTETGAVIELSDIQAVALKRVFTGGPRYSWDVGASTTVSRFKKLRLIESISPATRGSKHATAYVLTEKGRAIRDTLLRSESPKANPMKSLTYGTVPSKKEFAAALHRVHREFGDGDDKPPSYTMDLRGVDRRAAEGTEFDESGPQKHDVDSLYRGVNDLVWKWQNEDDDDAAGLASSILLTLNFEWI